MSGVDVFAVLDSVVQRSGHVVAHDVQQARIAIAELIEAAEAVAFVQINRRSVANDLGKAKQLRLRSALANVQGAK